MTAKALTEVKPQLKLSSRLKVPVWKVLDHSFGLWDRAGAEKAARLVNEFKEYEGGFPVVTLFGAKLKMPGYLRNFVLVRYDSPLWPRFYNPPFSCEGKTILDAGAGFGETAAYFISKGASKVICVESDPLAVKLLRENALRNGFRVEIKERRFELGDLDHVDFAKIDIEGGESILVGKGRVEIPCVMETHAGVVKSALCQDQGFHEIYRANERLSLVANYS